MKLKSKAYKFRLYPNKQQKAFFHKNFGCARFIYNQLLTDSKEHKKVTGQYKMNEVSIYKPQYPWLKEVDSLALANAKRNLWNAIMRYRNGVSDKPVLKKKTHDQSYTTNNQNNTIHIKGKYIRLPKIGYVKFKQHRPIEGVIKSATISKTSSGQYYISLTVQYPFEEKVIPNRTQVGIDLGITDLAILSDGTKLANIRPLKQYQEKLAKEQRKLSRMYERAKKEGRYLSESKNYQKQRLKVAKIHQKIRSIRFYLHKTTNHLVKNHDVIVLEDLSSKNLMKNRWLSKAIADVSWYEFKRQLLYKGEAYGTKILFVNRFYPSSQICSACGIQDGKKPLHIREWTCSSCGAIHDRDINAAKNILEKGLEQISA